MPSSRDLGRSIGAKFIFISRISTGFAPVIDRFSTVLTMTTTFPAMRLLLRVVVLASVALVSQRAEAAAPTLFRIFLTDGTEVVSYGEYARVGDEIVFSMAVGPSADDARVHLVTLPAAKVDWLRTDRASEATRADHYATTRGDEDFAQLSNEVARVLNDIALSTDRTRALALAQQARDVLARWSQEHYHYREAEVRDILSIIDGSIAGLKGEATGRFELALVASTEQVAPDSIRSLPPAQTQVMQLLHVADLMPRSTDRVSLLQTALALLEDSSVGIARSDASSLSATITGKIKHENQVDLRYARLTQQLSGEAAKAAEAARAVDVERVLAKIPVADAKLGGERPEVVQALRAAVEAKLDDARRLRLLRDQWIVRRRAYDEYQRRVGNQIIQLVKAQPLLESIRKLEGPAPDRLLSLNRRLRGGADRLQRQQVPAGMESVNDLLVGAWRFAETAANGRYEAVNSGNVTTAWSASSAAAGAMMLLSRAQDELRNQLEVPKLK
jgi:hypothetical protein